MSNREISSRDEELLSLFLDGELGEKQEQFLRNRLSQEVLLQEKLDELRVVRTSLRGWYQTELQKVKGSKLDIWAAIADEVGEIARAQQDRFQKRGTEFTFSEKFFHVLEGFRSSIHALSYRAAGIGVAAVLVLSFFFISSQEQREKLYQVAQNGLEQAPWAANARREIADTKLVVYRPTATAPLSISRQRAGDYLAHLRLRDKPVFPAQQIVGSDFVLGGLRADGLDIEGIASVHGVRLFAAEGRSEAPVIWVARNAKTQVIR